MECFKYIKISFRWIPEEIRTQYNLYYPVEPDYYVYCEVRKGMYGLKKLACLAFDNIVKLLAPHGYLPVQESPGLWKHQTGTTVFTLCVHNLGIKSNSMEDAHHLINATRKYFKCSIDWEGKNDLGLTLDWKYTKEYFDISMPGYIPTALQKIQHKPPARPQDAPHLWNKPVYVKHIQLTTQKISAPKINSADTNRIQSIDDNFLYYALEVDPTMLPPPNEIFIRQSATTQSTMDKFNQVLDYASTDPNANICYHASDKILMTYTDAAYLVLP